MPPMPGHPQPAMWDKNGYLRDWRNPTPGPIEALAPQRADRVTRRYVYGSGQLVQRETYRDRNSSVPEITRTIQTAPGTSAPVAWLDSDGVIDVQMKDRQGLPLWTYRARAGRRWFDASGPEEHECSGSGVLAALPLPGGSRYMDYPAWHLRAIEPDYLMGRRGLLGWSGTFDRYLLLDGPMPVTDPSEQSWWEEYSDWVIGGGLVLVGGILVATGVGAGFGVGLLIAGGGFFARGYASASRRNQDSWWSASPGVAGAIHGVGTAAVYVGGFVAGGAVFGKALTMGVGLGLGSRAVGTIIGTRMGRGQSGGEVFWGSLADISGVGGIWAGVTGKDIATGDDLGLDEFQRGQAFGMGLVQSAAVAYGAYRVGRWAAPKIGRGIRAGVNRYYGGRLRAFEAKYGTANVHSVADHGAQTTLAQQRARVLTGRTPSGAMRKTSTATRFLTNRVHYRAMRQAYRAQMRARSQGLTPQRQMVQFDRIIGEGYTRIGSVNNPQGAVYVEGDTALFGFDVADPTLFYTGYVLP